MLDLFNLNLFPLNKVISVQNTGTITNESGASTIIGSVAVTGKATIGVAGTSLTISNNNAFTASSLTNLVKAGTGSLILISNALPSATLLDLSAGTLDLSQAASSTLVIGNGQTIKGNGTLIGSLNAGVGSTVSPGASVGTLTVKGNVSLAGTNLMELNVGTNADLLRATNTGPATITYGGVLKVVPLAGTITATNTFKMFSASNYAGSFTALSPTTPGTGLGWNTNTLTTDGILRVVSTVNTARTNITFTVTGNQLNLSWPADHIGWRLQAQTNPVTVGLKSNWFDVPGSTTVSNITVPVNPANGSVFYRMAYP